MPARFQRQHSAVFIVRMRHRLHQPRGRAQPPQRLTQAQNSLILCEFGRSSLIGKLRKVGVRRLMTFTIWRGRNGTRRMLTRLRRPRQQQNRNGQEQKRERIADD